jgi:membrane-associated phospholipid phosphatase
VIAYFLLFQRTTKYICEHFDVIETYKKYKLLVVIASTLLAVGSMALIVRITFKIPEEHLKGLIAFSLCVLFSVVLAQGIVHGIKGIIGRQRYRTIKVLEYYGLNNFIDYTRWYVINGKRVVGEELLALGVAKDGYKSFPSGHTCAAAVTFVLATIPDFLNLDDKKRIRVKGILLVVALTYTSLVALSRVVIGAHFLTDVLFAGAWTYFSTVISAKISKLITKRMKL